MGTNIFIIENDIFKVFWGNDIGPYGKLLPLLKKKWKEDCLIITLDDDTYETVKDVKSKYIQSVTKEEEYSILMSEMEELVKIRKKKGKKAMMQHFEQISQAMKKKQDKELRQKNKKERKKNVTKLRHMLKEKNTLNDIIYRVNKNGQKELN